MPFWNLPCDRYLNAWQMQVRLSSDLPLHTLLSERSEDKAAVVV